MKSLAIFILSLFVLSGAQLCFAAQGKNPAIPWNGTEAQYSANVKTKKYHRPDCKFYQCSDCTKFFKSPAAAKKAGYEPCKVCGG